MKKALKITSLLIAIVIVLSSCSINDTDKNFNHIRELLNNKEYNECNQFIGSLEASEKSVIANDVLGEVSNQFDLMITEENVDISKIYYIPYFENEFTENCRRLWNIAENFEISKDLEFYNNYIYIRYFAELSNFIKYKELYSLLKALNENEYPEKIDNALYEYETNANTELFKDVYEIVSQFNYGKFNPQEYLISDFRTVHDKIVKNLSNLTKAFETNNSVGVASSVNSLKDNMTVILKLYDTLNAVNAKLVFVYNSLSNGESLHQPFQSVVDIKNRDYETGIGFSLEHIFASAPVITDEEESTTESNGQNSKNVAVKKLLNAINSTKAYSSNVSATVTERRNIQITEFDAQTPIKETAIITQSRLEKEIAKINGKKEKSYDFLDGVSETYKLSDFVPPYNKKASTVPDAIDTYSIIEGSAGTVITITFVPAKVKNNEQNKIESIINGFTPFEKENIKDSETYYSAVSVVATINHNELIEQIQYKIIGVNSCTITDSTEDNIYNLKFSFDDKYIYEFKY